MQLQERARAKVNLTLRVLGRRPDGYHDLESLVAFADVADRLSMNLAQPRGLAIAGPFAAGLAGQNNLVTRALDAAVATVPSARIGHVTLDKRLPVAAGIGGGSADAAAALRLVRAANANLTERELMKIAAVLGADVPVCLLDRPAIMVGTGTDVAPLEVMPSLSAVLVNPLVAAPANKTASVFTQLAAKPLVQAPRGAMAVRDEWLANATREGFIESLAASRNDLEAPAMAVMPVIADVLDALAVLPGMRLARLSGAGPSCFALFDAMKDAEQAAAELRRTKPDWWVVATSLQGSQS